MWPSRAQLVHVDFVGAEAQRWDDEGIDNVERILPVHGGDGEVNSHRLEAVRPVDRGDLRVLRGTGQLKLLGGAPFEQRNLASRVEEGMSLDCPAVRRDAHRKDGQ